MICKRVDRVARFVSCATALAAGTIGLLTPHTTWAQGPTHEYLFDTGSGSTAYDTGSVGGANGTLLGTPNWSTNTPFSGSGNYSVTTTSGGVEVSGGFTVASQSTISMWMYWSGATASPQYLLDGSSRTLVYFDASGGSPLIIYDGQSLSAGGLTQPTSVGWQNVILDRNGSALAVYENGTLKATNTLSSSAAFNPGSLFFGSRQSNTETVQGQIDEYAYWNRALSSSEAATVHSSSLGGYSSSAAPEPTSLLLACGALGLAAIRRRRAA